MRDYPQPWLEVKDMHLWGRLIGAEQEGLKRGLFIIFLFRLQRCVDFTMSLCQACHAYKMHFMTGYCGNLHIIAFVYTAKRSCKVSVGGPWGEMSVERNLPALKFYHDFSCGKYQNLHIFL